MLGADSTSSSVISPRPGAAGFHFLNHNQKLFQLGEESTVGVLTWGLAGLSNTSHRTLLAEFSDLTQSKRPKDLQSLANGWADYFWKAYQGDPEVQALLLLMDNLGKKKPYDPANPPDPTNRTKDEEDELENIKTYLTVGFCIAGYWLPTRIPQAFEVLITPSLKAPPVPREIKVGSYAFWGMPNMIKRLIWGADEGLRSMILQSGKWNGTVVELESLLNLYQLGHPPLPIRDAIDFVHSCIYSTIKAMKFSNMFQVCGGPIEIAVITTDRRFRWVRHKQWDAAIMEGAT